MSNSHVNSLIAAAIAPFAPAATDPTMQALVDQYGALDAQIKGLQGTLEMLKSAIKAQGAGKHEGLSYRATVYESAGRTITDWKAVAEHFNPSYQLITAHTNTSAATLTIKPSKI
jgi:hypothetical protein